MLRIAAALLMTAYASAADPAPPSSPALPQASPRAEFMAAMRQARESLPDAPDSAVLKSYPIYDYLVAARLRRDVAHGSDQITDGSVDTFLHAHGAQPVARALRRAWLVSLAQRRRWDLFLPRSADAADPVLICDRLSGRLETGDLKGLGADAMARWSLIQRAPAECASVFAWLHAQQLLTPALEEARARSALAADNPSLAQEFLGEVPAERAAPLRQWLQLLQTPRAALEALAASTHAAVEPDALVSGFTRLSNADASTALELLPVLSARPDLSSRDQVRLKRAAALGAAYARLPIAVAAFGGLSVDAADTQAQEWRVRTALWSGDYERARAYLELMPSALAAQPRWRYWHARSVSADEGADAAAPLFKEIADLRDYYGYLAADRLHQAYNLNNHPAPNDAAMQTALAAEPGLIRAHALFDCDLTDDAGAEWSAALSAASPAEKIQAARLASRWGWYAQAIATLAQAGEWDDVGLRYPHPYAAQITGAATLAQVPADWILAVMRQESLFRADAVSRADARGLMQMLPSTAVLVAKRWHLPVPNRDQLFDANVAIPLGAAHLRELLDHYGNQLDLTLAAYNAGPVALARWLPQQPIEADIWIENVPYTETRGYIQHVLEHIVAFASVRDAEPPRLTAMLPPVVAPRNDASRDIQ